VAEPRRTDLEDLPPPSKAGPLKLSNVNTVTEQDDLEMMYAFGGDDSDDLDEDDLRTIRHVMLNAAMCGGDDSDFSDDGMFGPGQMGGYVMDDDGNVYEDYFMKPWERLGL